MLHIERYCRGPAQSERENSVIVGNVVEYLLVLNNSTTIGTVPCTRDLTRPQESDDSLWPDACQFIQSTPSGGHIVRVHFPQVDVPACWLHLLQ